MDYYVKTTSVTIDGGFPCYQKNFIELFTIPEMESGFAWRTVNESSELPLWNPTEE